MKPEMRRIVESFLEMRRENPDEDIDLSTDFQRYLVENDVQASIDDLSEAAEKVGIKNIPAFLEELGSWL